MSRFLRPFNVLASQQRFRHRKRYNWYDEGIQYFGFKYYPRYPDFTDPPYEPSKLFRVQRIQSIRHRPSWEKHIIKEFKLDGKLNDVVIVKNIPENNHRLYKIKHLVDIKPIVFPDGFPTDCKGTYLNENGELRVVQNLEKHEEKLQLTQEFSNNPAKMDIDTLRRNSRKKWVNGW